MIIDPSVIDVDFSVQPQYVRGDNATRPFRSDRRTYSEAVGAPLIPQSEWPALAEKNEAEKTGLEWLVTRVFDQSSEGSCVGNAATQQHQVIQAKQFGIDKVVQLSPISLYQLIGRSASSGASIDDALDEGTNTGIIPLDTPENRTAFGTVVMPATGFRSQRPAGWEAVAQRFRFDESLICDSIDEMGTALFSGHPVVVGRAGHSITYLGFVFVNGKLYAIYVNSWGPWGSAAGHMPSGFGFDSLSYIRQSANWFYAVRSIITP